METVEKVKDLVVDVSSTEVRLALMENHRLVELNRESTQGQSYSVGDVYLGKVKKLLPALNAAFVDAGNSLFHMTFPSPAPILKAVGNVTGLLNFKKP